jgi:hypothetical protein
LAYCRDGINRHNWHGVQSEVQEPGLAEHGIADAAEITTHEHAPSALQHRRQPRVALCRHHVRRHHFIPVLVVGLVETGLLLLLGAAPLTRWPSPRPSRHPHRRRLPRCGGARPCAATLTSMATTPPPSPPVSVRDDSPKLCSTGCVPRLVRMKPMPPCCRPRRHAAQCLTNRRAPGITIRRMWWGGESGTSGN